MRDQEKLAGDIRPLVVNVMNFSKAGAGEPSLLSFDDAKTLFHEFGHALHALLSDVTYPLISGTSVLTDWVELPSQLYEHWLERPEILRRFALHCETGEPMPEELVAPADRGAHLQPGLRTVEYLASALVDLDLHLLADGEASTSRASSRHRSRASACRPRSSCGTGRTHFDHVFAGGGYAAAYYSYMWSEVMDADAFAAFEETGDIFDARDREEPARQRLCGRRLARSGRPLHRFPRPAADARRAAAAAGTARCRFLTRVSRAQRSGAARQPGWSEAQSGILAAWLDRPAFRCAPCGLRGVPIPSSAA